MGDKKFFDLAAIEQCRMLVEAQCSVWQHDEQEGNNLLFGELQDD
jgi:hypothetical protein